MGSGLKLTVIGGGSSYTPELIHGVIRHYAKVPVDRVVLVDIPEGAEKQKIVRELAERMVLKAGYPIRIEATLDRRQALEDADVVASQIRVGGLKARARDERIPLKYGIVGQETVGPGGFAKGLRTIPVSIDIARDVEDICPEAWYLNFTNPSGMVTEALLRSSGFKVVGLCNVPMNIQMAIAQVLNVDADRIRLTMFGLNHLSFVSHVYLDAQDIMPLVLGYLSRQPGSTVANIPENPWSPRLISAIGLIPNDYLRYYWQSREMLRHQEEQLEAGQGTRAIQVMAIEAELFRLYQDRSLDVKPELLSKRGGAYYSEVAVSVMAALFGGQPRDMVVNVANNGAIEGLEDEASVEVTCHINRHGAKPEVIGRMPLAVRGLIQEVKAYEALTIEAAISGDRQVALAALLANPLVPSAEIAASLLDDILRENLTYLPRFRS